MVTIPLYTLLFIYFLFLAIFAVFLLIDSYHIVMTASFTLSSFLVTFIIFALTTLTLYFTWQFLSEVDWQAPLTVFSSSWFTGLFSSQPFTF